MVLDASQPATLGAVVEAVTRISTLSEAQILELVSAGETQKIFPFRSSRASKVAPDTVAEDDLEEASPMPLSRERRAAIVDASMPPSRASRVRETAGRRPKISSKR